ncbi:hypothetical protein HDE_06437 [Halotydeus destructor]|nr:hypothetical protein HDE_06437 [Halotydeus destructor]
MADATELRLLDPSGQGTAWYGLSLDQRVNIVFEIRSTFLPDDRFVNPDYLGFVKETICERIALVCERYPVVLENIGKDLFHIGYSFNALRRGNAVQGANLRSMFTHHSLSMTVEERAIACYQDNYFIRGLPRYPDLVSSGQLSAAEARRLGRYRPNCRVPMAELSRLPAATKQTLEAAPASPGEPAFSTSLSTGGSPYGSPKQDKTSSPAKAGGQALQPDDPSAERLEQRRRKETEREKAAKAREAAKEEESRAKSRGISAYLDRINARPDLIPSSSHLLTGLPDEPPVSTANFYDWLHVVNIPYDAAIDELPGKQLTTSEGQQVNVPKYVPFRPRGLPFHEESRRMGRLGAEARDEVRAANVRGAMVGRFHTEEDDPLRRPPSTGPRVVHAPLRPGVPSAVAVQGNRIDPQFKSAQNKNSTEAPVTAREYDHLRPMYPAVTPPENPYRIGSEDRKREQSRREQVKAKAEQTARQEAEARKAATKTRERSDSVGSKVKKPKPSPK